MEGEGCSIEDADQYYMRTEYEIRTRGRCARDVCCSMLMKRCSKEYVLEEQAGSRKYFYQC